MTLRRRLTRTISELRSYLGLPTPFDEDQDDYWTAVPRPRPDSTPDDADDRSDQPRPPHPPAR